ncbi:MAG: prolipoprotein diacylglyceryl transferase [Clostridiales bacterium]|nr:prolipoprotein diacylglyceryl transferase [Clostridiales bacterium]
MNTLAFPQLGIELTVKRYFEIFGFRIYWYGVIIAVGFILALVYCLRRAARFRIKQDDIIDLALVAMPLAIIGARIMYVACNWDEFKGNFWSVFKIWNGGIAIYGGLILAIAGVALACRYKKISFWNFADLAVLGLLIGQIIGRWGNFINGEAYGVDVENFFLGMSINGGVDVHPIFLYESVWNLVGFVILHFWSRKRRFNGQIFLSYVAWYGIGRGFIEGIRAENVLTVTMFGTDIRISQAIAFVSALAALGVLAYKLLFTDRGDPIFLLTKEEAAEFRAAEKMQEKNSGSAVDKTAGSEEEDGQTEEEDGQNFFDSEEDSEDGGEEGGAEDGEDSSEKEEEDEDDEEDDEEDDGSESGN